MTAKESERSRLFYPAGRLRCFLIVEEVLDVKVFAAGAVQRVADLGLDVGCQTSSFTRTRDHLVGDVLCRRLDQVAGVEVVL